MAVQPRGSFLSGPDLSAAISGTWCKKGNFRYGGLLVSKCLAAMAVDE